MSVPVTPGNQFKPVNAFQCNQCKQLFLMSATQRHSRRCRRHVKKKKGEAIRAVGVEVEKPLPINFAATLRKRKAPQEELSSMWKNSHSFEMKKPKLQYVDLTGSLDQLNVSDDLPPPFVRPTCLGGVNGQNVFAAQASLKHSSDSKLAIKTEKEQAEPRPCQESANVLAPVSRLFHSQDASTGHTSDPRLKQVGETTSASFSQGDSASGDGGMCVKRSPLPIVIQPEPISPRSSTASLEAALHVSVPWHHPLIVIQPEPDCDSLL